MAVNKETSKKVVEDFTKPVREITGVARGNYLNGMEFALSLWQENLKVLNTQSDQWIDFQQNYAKAGIEFYEKLPKGLVPFWNGNSKSMNDEINHLVAFKKNCFKSITNTSDKLIKEAVSLTKRNAEKAFSLFDDYLNVFRA